MASRIEKTPHSGPASFSNRNGRMIIYQFFPRILTNNNPTPEPWGALETNGSGKFNDISTEVIRNLKSLGVNTLWFTGVIENATKSDFTAFGIPRDNDAVVKGEAGSPYAIKDYYDVNPCLAENVDNRLEEFRQAIKRVHSEGLKVIIDFVPNHTARQYHSDVAPDGIQDFGANDDKTKFFSPSNNYYYIPDQHFSPDFTLNGNEGEYAEYPAKATGNDCFSARCNEYDWYETVKLNYGRDYGDGSEHFDPLPDTWLKMLDILRYWASMGVDGFRCDMVFMVPLPFWHWVVPKIKEESPGIVFIGEIYDISLYRPFLEYGKFDYLYDKVNLYDTLVGIAKYGHSASTLSQCWRRVDGIGPRMLNFLENHDEVRFASSEFAGDAKKTVPYLVTSSMYSSGPYMVYYGQELGERAEDNEGFAGYNHRTTIFDYWSLASLRRWYGAGKPGDSLLTQEERWIRSLYSHVLNLCNSISGLRSGGFFDLTYANLQNPGFDPHSMFAWMRYDNNGAILLICNFGERGQEIKLNIPEHAIEITGIKEGNYKTEDLLWKKTKEITVSRNHPVKLNIGAYDAVIIPLDDNSYLK